MADIRVVIMETFDYACEIHRKEKQLSYESVMAVGKLQRLNAAVNLCMTDAEFFQKLGLTSDMFYKRCQAYGVIRFFPILGEMLKDGGTYISQLAMISAKITEANSDAIIERLKGICKRDLRAFLATIDKEGNRTPGETLIEVKMMMTQSEFDTLQRTRDILSAGGRNVSEKKAIVATLELTVERRDPMKKAERAEKRANKKSAGPSRSPDKSSAPGQALMRQPVPAAVVHQVWLRDHGRCTYISQSGQQCSAQRMLEIDHIVPVARGGGNDLHNLRLQCRAHNQWRADETFGRDWMARKRTAVGLSASAGAIETEEYGSDA
jgi:5-methylcytosine-specific restriction endonuclease McrA